MLGHVLLSPSSSHEEVVCLVQIYCPNRLSWEEIDCKLMFSLLGFYYLFIFLQGFYYSDNVI